MLLQSLLRLDNATLNRFQSCPTWQMLMFTVPCKLHVCRPKKNVFFISRTQSRRAVITVNATYQNMAVFADHSILS